MQQVLRGISLMVLLAGPADAALLSRLSGQAYYDTALDITWLADANFAWTSGYDGDGLMSMAAAQTWIASLNAANHLGVNDWRLPAIVDTGTPGCNPAYVGTDCGWNVDLSTGEMAHLYYSTLGNLGLYDTGGNETGCSPSSPWCLTNTGPFSNLQPYIYSSGTLYAPDPAMAWHFHFNNGIQEYDDKGSEMFAWAVRRGDIGLVPVPGAIWLFGSTLCVMGGLWRRLRKGQ